MIKPVCALTPKVLFKGQIGNSENPVNRKTEKQLALLNAGGISSVTGALTAIVARSYTSSWKHALTFGVGAAALTMMFAAPRFMYKSGINSCAKEKEMDVFIREKEVQKKLLTDVDEAIEEHTPDLPVKIQNYSQTKTPSKN